jgi:hypothetical protein
MAGMFDLDRQGEQKVESGPECSQQTLWAKDRGRVCAMEKDGSGYIYCTGTVLAMGSDKAK